MQKNDQPGDIDPQETQEWQDAIDFILDQDGSSRVQFLLNHLQAYAESQGVSATNSVYTSYLNTISATKEIEYPTDFAIEERIADFLRWNAMAIVVRGGRRASELGGHISSYASSLLLYEIGFNHFFHAPTDKHGGDLLYIQGHSSPGIYARAFLEGRITEQQLDHFREEVEVDGLASYPHPWLMPDFWQFPTVSMGLGPIQAIYQARFLKYLHNRELVNTQGRNVYVYCGDGEMDEPESLGAITLAGRENLDNLTFIINCNLQRLDGPVRGNGKIIQELEGAFRGAGWNVIKVLWDSHWEALFAKDVNGILPNFLAGKIDGQYQNFKAKDGAYGREHFFGTDPAVLELVADMSDADIEALNFGGHDWKKVYAAFHEAANHKGQPTVILAKTTKGFGMGPVGQGKNVAHQTKKLSNEDIEGYRQRFNIPIDEKQVAQIPYCKPAPDSPEIKYLLKQRKSLGGFLPQRRQKSETLSAPELTAFSHQLESSGDREISTTMAFVRLLSTLMKDKTLKDRIVPVIPDECRTFGMEGMFRQFGIYSPHGQQYKPVDADQLMYYREDVKGQVLNEGITEAGGFCSWLAAATSYSTNNYPMVPFYIFYSMFGLQRIGDLAWAAGDMRARGFLLGGTAGRTTLAGEGLQHQDGQSLVQASLIPNCLVYDPTYSYEIAVIIQDGLKRMLDEQQDCFYYITVMNENYEHPALPEGVEEGIIKGMYRLHTAAKPKKLHLQLMGSGTILREVINAAEILTDEFDVSSDIWSVPSFTEVARDAEAVLRHNRLHPGSKPKQSYIEKCLDGAKGSIVAATDYIRSYADQIREHVNRPYTVLGTDGFGRSDTRKKLRHYFEVDAKYIVLACLKRLADDGDIPAATVKQALKTLQIDPKKPNPVTG